MRVFALIALASLAGCAVPPGSAGGPAHPVPPRWFEAATLPDVAPLELAQRPTLEQTARALPAEAATPFRAWFECAPKANGALDACTWTRLWPNNETAENAARALLPYVRLTPEAAALARRSGGKVHLGLFIDDASRDLERACPRDWCAVTPPPPPVPAPPSGA